MISFRIRLWVGVGGGHPYDLPVWTLDASGSLTYAGYDSNGVRAFSGVDSNAQSVYGLPSAAAALRHAAPYANVVTSLASDDFGRVKSSTDAMGQTTYFAYKDADDRSSVTTSFPDGRQTLSVTDRRKGYTATAEVTDQDDDLASPSQGSVVTSLSRVSFDVAGRKLSQDDFVDVLGVLPDLSNVATYTAAIVADPNHAPSSGDRFYRTTYGCR
jgi:YD repeat-containing protein